MKYGISILSMVLIIFMAFGCRKKNNAGLGGDNELQVTVKHHAVIQDSITVYVKFNTQDAPASINDYEISAEVEEYEGEKIAIFTGLKDGEYYLYGKGWDPDLVDDVEGGLPIEICDESGPKTVDLQVTEAGH
jgi:hypothetical protein